MKSRFIYIFFASALIYQCKVDPPIVQPVPVKNLQQEIPDGWPQPVYTFSNNEVNDKKFELGRSLFYETMLSKDNSISCGSCHQIFAAFANSDHKFSHGVLGLLGKRNAPALFNLAWLPLFMHDGGINHIEVQPLGPIANPIEMNEDFNHVLDKLRASEKYKTLFKAAFGDEEINSDRFLKSIAQFQGLLLSSESKYDHVKSGESKFTAQEENGYSLFKNKCVACHAEPLFSDFKFRNNGLSVDPILNDGGRGAIKPDEPEHLYCFKTPSLRNVEFSYPYMHDGRYATLEACLDHYTSAITNTVNLDPLLQNGLVLSAQDKQDLIVFLKTLSDYEFINDARFKDPNFK